MYLQKINSEYCYDNIIIIIWAALVFIQFRTIHYSKWCGKAISYIAANTFGVFLIHQYCIDMFDLTNRVNSVVGGLVLWAGICVGCFIVSFVLGKIPIVKEALKY